jgi:hypothetical protein
MAERYRRWATEFRHLATIEAGEIALAARQDILTAMRRTAPWQDGRRAWARLDYWFKNGHFGAPLPPIVQGPDACMTALRDVKLVRDLIGQAEYAVVNEARRQGKSWTDIGVALGMTRQSAWERWHQDDDTAETS